MPVSRKTLSQTTVSPRIRDLQKKIQDSSYVDYAVERIALIVSRQIVEKHNSGRTPEKTY
ncbi:MAG TPA: hypothetical protein DEO40_06710 [Treponema sp.]|jgi:hypothetical protein|nr:hypothetical protein [Treponema sp.]HBB42391.1 hypothetical protein [Treponema sp.]HCA20350.1 hypothetical protein [Treponema sp.]